MADLRNLVVQPIQAVGSTDSTYIPGAQNIAAGAQALSGLAADLTRTNTAKAKQAHDQALGTLAGEYVQEQASFLADSVENQAAREAAQRAADEGVQVGESGTEVLDGAGRLANVEGYLRTTGQMNTLNQIRILTKQAELIKRRPDLGEDIIRLTNAASADANAILKKNEDDAVRIRTEKRAHEEAAYDKILEANNAADPTAPLSVKRQRANVFQHYLFGKQMAADQLLSLQQDDQSAVFQDNVGKRALEQRQRDNTSQSLDLLQTSWLPNKILQLSDIANQIAKSDSPTKEADWAAAQAGAVADLNAVVLDPNLRAQALATLNQQIGVYKDVATGKSMTDQAVSDRLGIETSAYLKIYQDHPEARSLLPVIRDLGPSLAQLGIGRSRAMNGYANTLGALFTQMATEAGVNFDPNPIGGVPPPRSQGKAPTPVPDYGAGSPYTLPGQQPRQVEQAQVKQTTADLLDVVRSVGQVDGALPSSKRAAAQAVIAALSDPVVARDGNNVRDVIYGLASSDNVAKAFTDNQRAPAAREVAYNKMTAYFNATQAAIERELNTPIDSLVEGKVGADGTVVFKLRPGTAGLPPYLAQRLNQDANAAVRAWAHLNGTTDYGPMAVDFFTRRQNGAVQ